MTCSRDRSSEGSALATVFSRAPPSRCNAWLLIPSPEEKSNSLFPARCALAYGNCAIILARARGPLCGRAPFPGACSGEGCAYATPAVAGRSSASHCSDWTPALSRDSVRTRSLGACSQASSGFEDVRKIERGSEGEKKEKRFHRRLDHNAVIVIARSYFSVVAAHS